MSTTRTLQPNESRLFSMSFSQLLKVGETVTSIVSVDADPAGLTISEQAIEANAKSIQFRIEVDVGNVNSAFKVTSVVGTSDSNTLEGEGILLVKDK